MTTTLVRRAGVAAVFLAFVALFAALFVGGAAGRASAHASLDSSDPAAGSVLTASPDRITLRFDEPVTIDLGGVRLFDGSGTTVEIGEARHGRSGSEVVVEVPELSLGSYVVDWRVISADSHPAHGAFTFQIGELSDLQPGVIDTVIESQRTDRAAQVALAVARGIVVAAIAVVIGGAVGVLLGAFPPLGRLRWAMRVLGTLGAAAGFASIGLEAGYVSGDGIGSIVDADAWRALADTGVGVAWIVRACVLAVSGWALAAIVRDGTRARSASQVAVVIAAAVLGVTSALGGHGSTGRWQLVGTTVTVVHVVAMAVWVGGLAGVVLCVGHLDDSRLRRFSSIALVAAAVTVGSGVLQTARQVPDIGSFSDTTYGKLLVAKVLGVSAVLVLAAVARRAVFGTARWRGVRQRSADGSVAQAVGADVVHAAPTVDRAVLRKAVGLELAIAAAVLGLSSGLMGSNPSAQAASGPFSVSVVEADYLLTVTVDPARTGLNQVHLYLSSPLGALDQPRDVTLRLANPDSQVAALEIPVYQAGAGHYQALEASLPFPGRWDMEVGARFGEFTLVSFRTSLDIE